MIKGALAVTKAKRFGNLYELQGAIIIGATIVSSSSMTNSYITKIWCMRLRHVSERELTVLSMRGPLCGQSIGKKDGVL